MRQFIAIIRRWVLPTSLALTLTATAWGQGGGNGGGGGGGGGGFGGGGLGGGGGGLGGGMGGSMGSGGLSTGLGSSGLGSGGAFGNIISGSGSTISGSAGSYRNRGGSGGSQSISNTNPFSSYYVNPMSLGLGTTSTGRGSGGFTSPLYGTTSTTSSYGGTATLSGGNTNSTTPVGGTSMGMVRQMYGVNMGAPAPAAGQFQVRSDLQTVIARSSSLPSKGSIRVVSEGDIVVLQGSVQDEHERRLAEALVRFTPGVREVRNELVPRQTP